MSIDLMLRGKKIDAAILEFWARAAEDYSKTNNVAVWFQLDRHGIVLTMIDAGEKAHVILPFAEVARVSLDDAMQVKGAIENLRRRLRIMQPLESPLPLITPEGLKRSH